MKLMHRTITTATVLAALAMASSAQAASPATNDPVTASVQRSLAIAATFWGASPPCPAGVSVYRADLSFWNGPLGVTIGMVLPTDACAIWLDLKMYLFRTVAERVDRCTLLVHEFGHALGHPHSQDPLSIMNPTPLAHLVVESCWFAFTPVAQRRDSRLGLHFARRSWARR